jgi:hypothetical protein
MIGGFSGTGKSSWMFANMAIPLVEQGKKVCIMSNEQKSKEFKTMLLSMILANEFKYFGLTRKKIKIGQWNPEQKEMIGKATKFYNENYKGKLKFVRFFDYDVNKVKLVVRKLAKQGFEAFFLDTFKSSSLVDGQFWQQLIEDSKQLFQLVAKEDVAMVTTYQLSQALLGRRWLDASCLSNSKGIKEVYSEMVYFRQLYNDEFEGQKYDIKPYNWVKGADGKYTDVKQFITLDKEKKYLVAMVDKTRNDEDKQAILYEFNGRFNMWKELGYCTVTQDFTK